MSPAVNGNGNGNGHRRGRRRALVTGCAGFIGSHLTERLLSEGYEVVGVDCFSDFYAPSHKEANLESCLEHPHFTLERLDLASESLTGVLDGVEDVFHLAAQPGVRGSFGDSFESYVRNNVYATQRLLEAAAVHPVRAFVYASSSSIYGNAPTPSHERTDPRPISPYGMTKLAAEEICAVYHRNSGVPVIGLRYFTVYGPRQRPDMALSRFLRRALADEPLPVVGNGLQRRDFTYVDDIVEGTLAAARRGRPATVYNIGGGHPVTVLKLVNIVEELLERVVDVVHLPAAMGDPTFTHADTSRARDELGFAPKTPLHRGIAQQLLWMRHQPETDLVDIAGVR